MASSRSTHMALASAGASAAAVVAATYYYRHHKPHPKHSKNEPDAPSVTSTVEPDSMLTEDSYQEDGQPLVVVKERSMETEGEFEPLFPEFTTAFHEDDAVENTTTEKSSTVVEPPVTPKKTPSLWRTKVFMVGVLLGLVLVLYGATRDYLEQHYSGDAEIAPAPKLVVGGNDDDKSVLSKVVMGAYGVAAYVLYSCKNGG